MSFAAPVRTDEGWVFEPKTEYCDALFGHRACIRSMPRVTPRTGRVTTPLLFDTKRQRLVSNESADLVRMLPVAFAEFASLLHDFYPAAQRPNIDYWNDRIYPKLNNGVYRAGFAESQKAYELAVGEVFETLDAIEDRLAVSRYFAGDSLTEADIRLFPTLVRFDVAYFTAFKCSRRRIVDYPHIWRYARNFYARPGVAQTVAFDIYRRGYSSQSDKRNPLGIVPIAPVIDWSL